MSSNMSTSSSGSHYSKSSACASSVSTPKQSNLNMIHNKNTLSPSSSGHTHTHAHRSSSLSGQSKLQSQSHHPQQQQPQKQSHNPSLSPLTLSPSSSHSSSRQYQSSPSSTMSQHSHLSSQYHHPHHSSQQPKLHSSSSHSLNNNNNNNNTNNNKNAPPLLIPLRGKLRRIQNNDPSSNLYSLTCQKMELYFSRTHYEHIHRLFCIVDTESRGLLRRTQVQEFVALRCPVFRRRDAAIQNILNSQSSSSPSQGTGTTKEEEAKNAAATSAHSSSGGGGGGVKGVANAAIHNMAAKMSSLEHSKMPHFGNLISFPHVSNPLNNLVKKSNSHKSSNHSSSPNANSDSTEDNSSHRNSASKDVTVTRWNSTFEEVWYTVVSTSFPSNANVNVNTNPHQLNQMVEHAELSLEGWMLFCRLIALAQYQEAKSRFSAKHLQQPNNFEMIMVELPPPTPPPPLNLQALLELEQSNHHNNNNHHGHHHGHASNSGDGSHSHTNLPAIASLPLPELDLNHCLIAAHDIPYAAATSSTSSTFYTKHSQHSQLSQQQQPTSVITVTLFGASSSSERKKDGHMHMIHGDNVHHGSSSNSNDITTSDSLLHTGEMEFVVTTVDHVHNDAHNIHHSPYNHHHNPQNHNHNHHSQVKVKRTMQDMEWLRETFAAHQRLGGTLCGRILPPFPSDHSHYQLPKGGGVSGVVGSGVIMAMHSLQKFTNMSMSMTWGKKEQKWEHVQGIQKAKELERCLNYFMEHPALRTSFPLNAILKASQSGLDAAKRILDNEENINFASLHSTPTSPSSTPSKSSSSSSHNHTNHSNNPHYHANTTAKFDLSNFFSNFTTTTMTGNTYTFTEDNPNLAWIRTAAQAAMALKLHGILDATGCASASAKLQHASLPSFDTSKWWRGDYNNPNGTGKGDDFQLMGGSKHHHSSLLSSSHNKQDKEDGMDDDDECFEHGVVSIESELESDEAYDLLPSPTHTPRPTNDHDNHQPHSHSHSHSHLDHGYDPKNAMQPSSPSQTSSSSQSQPSSQQQVQAQAQAQAHAQAQQQQHSKKFYYGKEDPSSVDNDIHKLYEIINAMENTLSRCRVSSCSIADARKERNSLHLAIVKGLDSWEGLRGEIVGERALMEGVVGLERVKSLVEDSDWSLRESISWQSALATSAVSAAETVRSAVRAARTALSAKTAAESAALAAQKHCTTSSFSTPDEARAAQTKASISHSHAIHAAVIEHEAFGAKRRAAMALAHDVNCWNEHRKREMLLMLKKSALSQKEAARASRISWVGLREGMYGVTSYNDCMKEQNGEVLLTHHDLDLEHDSSQHAHYNFGNSHSNHLMREDHCSPSLSLSSNSSSHNHGPSRTAKIGIVPVVHKSLAPSPLEMSLLLSPSPMEHSYSYNSSNNNNNHSISPSSIPFPNLAMKRERDIHAAHALSPPSSVRTHSRQGNGNGNIVLGGNVGRDDLSDKLTNSLESTAMAASTSQSTSTSIATEENDVMTASMQSLVDGLMSWGGRYDPQDDMSLPSGMAVSIALEESGVLNHGASSSNSNSKGGINTTTTTTTKENPGGVSSQTKKKVVVESSSLVS